MARRGRSNSFSRRPAQAPTALAKRPVPTQVAPQPAPMASQGPSLLGNIASTAAGVAIGHTVGHAITGSFSGGSAPVEAAAPTAAAPPAAPGYQQQQQTPCQYEFQQFLNCTQQQPDLSLCEGFNQMLKECKLRYGPAQM